MSDWSVRRLIDEYRPDAQENTDPRLRSKPGYNDALQGVLAAMFLDEPSPSSVSIQNSAHGPRIVRTTEEALGALLDSTYRGDYSPASPASSLQLDSSSRLSSAGRGIVGLGSTVLTSDVISHLIGDLEASSGRNSVLSAASRSRLDPLTQSSGSKDPLLAAANRMFDQSRYSLAADWKPGDPRHSQESASDTSLQRRDSESGLDRADFALLPPALGKKPLTPLGEKDKVKASTPPEPVPTRTLVDRKKAKEQAEPAPVLIVTEPVQDLPHAEIVRPVVKKVAKPKAGRRNSRGRMGRKKEAQLRHDEEVPSLLEMDDNENADNQPNADIEKAEYAASNVIVSHLQSEGDMPEPSITEVPLLTSDNPRSIDSHGNGFNIYNTAEFSVIDDPVVVAMAENGGRMSVRRRAAMADRDHSNINPKENSKKGRGRNSKGGNKEARDSKPVIQVESVKVIEKNAEVGVASETMTMDDNHLHAPPDYDFDSQDSDSRDVGGAVHKLQTIAKIMNEKPPSPAAWITPRPAGQGVSHHVKQSTEMPTEKQQPSVQVELSEEITPFDQLDEEAPSSIVPYIQPPDDPMGLSLSPVENVAEDSDTSEKAAAPMSDDMELPQSDRSATSNAGLAVQKRRSMPKRSVRPATLEIVPIDPPDTSNQLIPARKGGRQSYGIQVSTVRATVSKPKAIRLDSMQPGKLRRISICDEQGDAEVEAGKIIRTARKRIRVPALRWWAGERIEYKSEDGTLGRTIATAVYRKEDEAITQSNQKSRFRRLKDPLALPAAPMAESQVNETLAVVDNRHDVAKCKLRIELTNSKDNGVWSNQKPRVVPAIGVNRKNVVIRRADVPNGWDLYKKNEMCFSANVLLQNDCFASILFRLPPSETNGVDDTKNTHMLVEFVSGATLLVLMSRESASTVEHGEIVGERKGVELSRACSKVMIPPHYRYQFKNVSETEESLLVTHVVSENKQSFFSK